MRHRLHILLLIGILLYCQLWLIVPLNAQSVVVAGWYPDRPSARRGHTLAAGKGTVFLFGGETIYSSQRQLNDLWTWEDGKWRWQSNTGPTPRSWTALAYDEQRHELVLFGGWNGRSELNDTWIWRDGSWSQRTPANSPPARRQHAMAYHAPSGQIVLFGGSSGGLLSDTWIWNGETWTNVTGLHGPSARRSHGMAYDAQHGHIILFGGEDINGSRNDTWIWDGVAWSRQSLDSAPPARFKHSLISMPDSILLFGGENGPHLFNDTWQWDGSKWHNLNPSVAPSLRSAAAAAYNAKSREVLLFGGSGLTNLQGDTWAWDGTQWQPLNDVPAPTRRSHTALVDDVGRKVAILFGGIANGIVLSDTWVWNSEIGWRQALPATNPPPRFGHAMAYDPIRDEVVLFGGYNQQSRNDTWVWNGETWTQREPSVSPPPRWGHTMTFDAAQGRILLFGGAVQTGGFYQDTWAWDGANWIELHPQTSPPPRRNHATAYDSVRSRIVLFGGYGFDGTQRVYYNDTWEWDGTNWQQRSSLLTPRGRTDHALLYDAMTQQTMLIGGRDESLTERSIWVWNGETWQELQNDASTSPLPPIAAPVATYQIATCRTIIVDVTGTNGRITTWQRDTSPCVAAPTARIESIVPNPANRSTDQIILIGSGDVAPGSGRVINAYRWMLNGSKLIGTTAEIRLPADTLTVDTYRVTLAVRDNAGMWSTPVEQQLIVLDHPRLTVKGEEVRASLVSGSQTERTIAITNTGGSPLSVELTVDLSTNNISSITHSLPSVTAPLAIPRISPLEQRLDPRLREFIGTAATTDEITYLALLNEIADLSAAEKITDWRERGRYVVKELQAVANRTQEPILALLAEQKQAGNVSEYWPLYSINAIIVRGNGNSLRTLNNQPQMVVIKSMETLSLIEVTDVTLDKIRQTNAQPLLHDGWNITRIGADRVWNEFNTRGEGVVVGIIDTGVYYKHKDLIKTYRGYNVDGSEDHRFSWFDPTSLSTPEPTDPNGHGTHVLGIIVGDKGIGVAPGARWIAARGCYARECNEFDLLRAMEWMLAPYPISVGPSGANPDLRPHVVNNSWGAAGGKKPFWQSMVSVWRAAGIFPVFAAGNKPSNQNGTCPILSPADYGESFAVGATDGQDKLAVFSCIGPSTLTEKTKPDVVAPGVNIISTWKNGQYHPDDGTSMASPHVAGTAALLLSVRPRIDIDQILHLTARDLGEPGADYQTGFGLLDAYKAIKMAMNGWKWADVHPTMAVLQPSQTNDFTIRFDSRGLAAGQYIAHLVIHSDDPNRPEFKIPLHLLVQTVPQRRVTPSFTHITANGFVVRWRSPDEGIAMIEYKSEGSQTWMRQTGRASSIPNETVFILERLEPRTNYLLRFIRADGTIVDDNEGKMYQVTTASPLLIDMDNSSSNVLVLIPLVLR